MSFKGVSIMDLSSRQKEIIEMVKEDQPITSEQIAEKLSLTRAALRTDLAILTMIGILDARPKVGYFYSGKSILSSIGSYMKNLNVEEVKSLPIIVFEETTVYDAIVTLFLEDVGTVFVQNQEKNLSGIISRKDFLKIAIGNHDIQKMPVAMIMTRMPNIAYVYADESLYDAAVKIINHEVDSLPVVEKKINDNDSEGLKIIGKISKTTITEVLVKIGKE